MDKPTVRMELLRSLSYAARAKKKDNAKRITRVSQPAVSFRSLRSRIVSDVNETPMTQSPRDAHVPFDGDNRGYEEEKKHKTNRTPKPNRVEKRKILLKLILYEQTV